MGQWLAVRAQLIEKEALVRVVLMAWFLFGHVLDTSAAGEVLSGRVVGTDGRPIAGATVNGNTRVYQCWYRSNPALCSPAALYNLTQGLQLTWGP